MWCGCAWVCADSYVVSVRSLDEFMAGFSVISLKLKEMYQMLTLGGTCCSVLLCSVPSFLPPFYLELFVASILSDGCSGVRFR